MSHTNKQQVVGYYKRGSTVLYITMQHLFITQFHQERWRGRELFVTKKIKGFAQRRTFCIHGRTFFVLAPLYYTISPSKTKREGSISKSQVQSSYAQYSYVSKFLSSKFLSSKVLRLRVPTVQCSYVYNLIQFDISYLLKLLGCMLFWV